jgi:hypothetical protein
VEGWEGGREGDKQFRTTVKYAIFTAGLANFNLLGCHTILRAHPRPHFYTHVSRSGPWGTELTRKPLFTNTFVLMLFITRHILF